MTQGSGHRQGTQTTDIAERTLDSGHRAADTGQRTLDRGHVQRSGHWAADTGQRTLDSGHWTGDMYSGPMICHRTQSTAGTLVFGEPELRAFDGRAQTRQWTQLRQWAMEAGYPTPSMSSGRAA